jgi:short-subunit dehydrogenase
MQLNRARILLTGATGGLGQALATELAAAGAAVLLAGRNTEKLAGMHLPSGSDYATIGADLTTAEGIEAATAAARHFGVNVLINNAGVGCFGLLEEQGWAAVEQVFATNLAVPVRLTQALLPWLRSQPEAVIVNIGSTFGSIPFPGFAAYSAAKAGLRGFSQALRRELADTLVRVVHIAPRAIDTPLNSPEVVALNRQLKNNCDTPETVAAQIIRVLRNGEPERHLGFPERLFAWLNGFAPALVDRGLAGKLAAIKQHASRQ